MVDLARLGLGPATGEEDARAARSRCCQGTRPLGRRPNDQCDRALRTAGRSRLGELAGQQRADAAEIRTSAFWVSVRPLELHSGRSFVMGSAPELRPCLTHRFTRLRARRCGWGLGAPERCCLGTPPVPGSGPSARGRLAVRQLLVEVGGRAARRWESQVVAAREERPEH